jgi:ribonuclease HI
MLERQFVLHINHRDLLTVWSLHERVTADTSQEILVGMVTRETGGTKSARANRRERVTNAALLGAIEWLDGSGIPDGDVPSTLLIFDVAARTTMRNFASRFGSLTVPVPADYPAIEDWQAEAGRSCQSMIEAKLGAKRRKKKQQLEKPVVSAATDGSYSKSEGGGCGWIREDGMFGSFPLRCASPLEAEVFAIKGLLLASRKMRLDIVTDSRRAIEIVEGRLPIPETASPRFASAIYVIRAQLAWNGSVLRWVRGHNGDPMNEGADRLAVLSRRQHNIGISPAVTQQVGERIAIETLNAHSSGEPIAA